MSFRQKIIVLLMVVAVVPVAVSGLMAMSSSEDEILSRVTVTHKNNAYMVSDEINNYINDALRSLQLATEFIPFEQFPVAQLNDAVRIPYRQFDYMNIVALLESSGHKLCTPAYESTPAMKAELVGHQPVSNNDLTLFNANIPLAIALRNGYAISEVYFSEQQQQTRIAIAVVFPVDNGNKKWMLAAEISLEYLNRQLEIAASSSGGIAFVLDNRGTVIAHSNTKTPFKRNLSQKKIIGKIIEANQQNASIEYTTAKEEIILGAFAKIPIVNWALVVEQKKEDALASVFQIQRYTLFWVGVAIIIALAGGIVLSRGVSRPVTELARAVKAIDQGDFSSRLPVHSSDELGQLSVAFNQMTTDLSALIEQHERLFVSSIHTLVASVEAKDVYTRGHSERVTSYALVLCDAMNLPKADREIAELAGLLHDVGKIGIPEVVLNKPDKLTNEEYHVIQTHPEVGSKIVHKIQHPDIDEVTALVRGHHEKWDGTGYPDGLKEEQIPLIARILAVVDAFDAMTSDRAYRKGMPEKRALSIMEECSGTQFDPAILSVFCEAARKNKIGNNANAQSKYVKSDFPPAIFENTRKIRTDRGERTHPTIPRIRV